MGTKTVTSAERCSVPISDPYGPDNPHPLSQLRTQLVWEGKYDEYGRRREVDIASAALPLQKIETIDEPRSRAEAVGDQQALFALNVQAQKLGDFRNQLIWGDNKLVMASLLKEFQGKIDLIYIDPPFDVGADFTMDLPLGDGDETVPKDQSTLELVAYRDMWGKGTDSYLHMMYTRLALLRDLLSEKGSIYVHCDWRVNSYMRLVLDEIFGNDNLRNQIVWSYSGWRRADNNQFSRKHDSLLYYSKSSENWTYHKVSESWVPGMSLEELKILSVRKDENGDFIVLSEQKVYLTELLSDYLATRKQSIKSDEVGEFVWADGRNTVRRYLRDVLVEGRAVDDVWNIRALTTSSTERLGYDTQKPETLVERIIKSSSNEGDLVADFFCGSGTTGAVAERMGRRWIMCDLGRFAIHTSRKRLIELQRILHNDGQAYRAFDVYNLGRYERQWWQKEHLKGANKEHRRTVLEFYKAEPIQNSTSPLIHGRKGPALVHVDSIDSIFTRRELRLVAEAAKAAGAKQVNCLAWEFEMDLRLQANSLQAELGIEIRLVRIPREIMEKNRTQVTFFEIATLQAEPVIAKGKERAVNIKLKTFLPSLAEIPEKELQALEERAIKHGFDFIDFWAVDFDYRDGQPFKHHWQAYRTRKDRSLPTISDQNFVYPTPGKHTACVKVVDTFGCDTSITVPIEI
jgi:adenine-specific DNA-methyltransferase